MVSELHLSVDFDYVAYTEENLPLLEAGMAKLFATETAAAVTLEAMRVMGGNGYSKDFTVERLYRDAPLLLIGGGTNEIQRLVIARRLLELYRVD